MKLKSELITRVENEIDRAVAKWGEHDKTPDNLISGAVEELGEAAHAFNHNEGRDRAQKEIVQTMGILVRLYDMAEELH